jgi:hypothetical protein
MKLTFGIPLFLMKKYLVDLGAVEQPENIMVGPGWQATLRKAEPVRLGSLKIGRIEMELSGEEAAMEAMQERLHLKTLRGGG